MLKTIIGLIVYLLVVLFTSCSSNLELKDSNKNVIGSIQEESSLIENMSIIYGCDSLTKTFKSYEDAYFQITNTTFMFYDSIVTSESTWIRNAYYYSCDSLFGYFIINTDNQYYIHNGLPIETWYNFINSSSHGSYYNKIIKNRYSLFIM